MIHKQWAEETLKGILKKLDKTASQIGARFPHACADAEYDEMGAEWWTNGFWPGMLWMAYLYTNDEKYAAIAKEVENKMDEALDGYELLCHDIGFMWMLSSGANYKITESRESRLRLLKAASHLAGRFNLKGNFIRAWKGHSGWAIIDCVMNLPILYWATEKTEDPRFAHIAKAHLSTVMKYFMRPDGSVNHVVSFDADTGDFIEPLSGQAAAPDSAWSRGSAWAIYGLALAYRYFKSDEMLAGCKRAANFFLANLPEDYVAHWDFRVERNADTPRDTSAAACAACGLLELVKHVPEQEGKMYYDKAYRILRSLTDNYANLEDDSKQAILRGATGHLPAGKNINVGLIYGDFFYMEGITRLAGNEDIFWYAD